METTLKKQCNHFNPRSREGSDVYLSRIINRLPISIHAPAKGATVSISKPLSISIISIHAPAKGATFLMHRQVKDLKFQSTLPRRERPGIPTVEVLFPVISIHAPAKGATIDDGRHISALQNFNPRSREGSD